MFFARALVSVRLLTESTREPETMRTLTPTLLLGALLTLASERPAQAQGYGGYWGQSGFSAPGAAYSFPAYPGVTTPGYVHYGYVGPYGGYGWGYGDQGYYGYGWPGHGYYDPWPGYGRVQVYRSRERYNDNDGDYGSYWGWTFR